MTQNPQVPRCRSSVAIPPRTTGEGPWLAIPDFSISTTATPAPGEDSRVLESQLAGDADGRESTLPPPVSSASMTPSPEETPTAIVAAADAAREIVASPGEQSPSPVDTGAAVRELLQNSTTGRLRRWVQWGANDPRKAVTVLGGVALALLVVLRSGSTGSRPAPSPTPDADQLSREVRAIERLSNTPLRLASAPATASATPAVSGGNAEKDSLFEVKLLKPAKMNATAGRSSSVGADEAPLRELSAAATPDSSGNQQAADVRPVAATQDRPSPSDTVEESPADPAGKGLEVVHEGTATHEELLAPRRPAKTKGYPSTDAVKYPAYRFEDASQTEEGTAK